MQEQRGHLLAQFGTISGQIFEMSSKTKGPNSVLTSKGVSDVPIYDGRAETFEDWLFKVKGYNESEDDGTAKLLERDHEIQESTLRQCEFVGSEDLCEELQRSSDGSRPTETQDYAEARNDFTPSCRKTNHSQYHCSTLT